MTRPVTGASYGHWKPLECLVRQCGHLHFVKCRRRRSEARCRRTCRRTCSAIDQSRLWYRHSTRRDAHIGEEMHTQRSTRAISYTLHANRAQANRPCVHKPNTRCGCLSTALHCRFFAAALGVRESEKKFTARSLSAISISDGADTSLGHLLRRAYENSATE